MCGCTHWGTWEKKQIVMGPQPEATCINPCAPTRSKAGAGLILCLQEVGGSSLLLSVVSNHPTCIQFSDGDVEISLLGQKHRPSLAAKDKDCSTAAVLPTTLQPSLLCSGTSQEAGGSGNKLEAL